jgi:hypothetical protein
VNAEFNWWLLIVGLVVGAGLTWLVMAESARRDADVGEDERRGEAVWIASMLSSPDRPVEPRRVEEILRLHGEYLAGPPPDEPDESDEFDEPEAFDEVHEPEESEGRDELQTFEELEAERASAAAPAFVPVAARPKAVGRARPKAGDTRPDGDAAATEPEATTGAPPAPARER